MKVAIFFVLTAFLGIASCDLVCMQFKLSSCFSVLEKGHFGNSLCAANKEFTDCLRNGARKCKVKSSPIVEEVLVIFTDTCKEGTQMNELYKKHKTCVFQDAAIGNGVCIRPLVNDLLAIRFSTKTRQYQERVMKVACKYGDSGDKCIHDNVNSTCGDEAAKFRHHLSYPSFRLSKQACEEIQVEINEIHYALQQHDDFSVHAMAPHTQHLSAAGPQAGSIQIASTVAPWRNELQSGAITLNVSSQLIYILVATIFMKCFSSY